MGKVTRKRYSGEFKSTPDHGLQPQRTRSLSRSRGRDIDMGSKT